MNNKKLLNPKDIVIIVCSIIALVVLCVVLLFAKKNKEKTNEELTSYQDDNDVIYDKNRNSLVCNEANAAGWLEFYNASKDTFDFSKMIITLNGEEVYTFDDGVKLKSADRVTVDIGKNPGELTDNYISLKDASGKRILDCYVPALSDDQSYGCVEDGGSETSIMTASRDESNEKSKPAEISTLEFSVPGGFYSDDVSLNIKAPEGYKVYYTDDGTKPSMSSNVYEYALDIKNKSGTSYIYADKALEYARDENYYPSTVDMGTEIRAIMVDADNNVAAEKKAVYYVGLNEDNKYLDMPILSITTEGSNLFDYFDGIYVSGRSREDAIARGENTDRAANFFNKWWKDAEVQYYEPDFGLSYKSDAQIQIADDNTTSARQKPFNVTVAKEELRGTSLADFVDDEGKFQLSCSDKDATYRMRDLTASALLSANAVGTEDIQPCSLFINGEYWGCYMMKRPYNASYIKTHYNVSDQAIEFCNNDLWNDRFEEFYRFVVNSDMSVDANYQQFLSMADIESLADYIAVNMYISNADFSIKSGTAWRTAENGSVKYADSKWRWLLGDVDNSMGNKAYSGSLTTATIDTFLMNSYANEPFIQSLMMNEGFRKAIDNSVNKLADNSFTEENVDTVVTTISEKLKKPIIATDARFYGNITDTEVNKERDSIKEFFNTRRDYILKYSAELTNMTGNMDVLNEARGVAEEVEQEENGEVTQ